MFKALTALRDGLFNPINAFLFRLIGGERRATGLKVDETPGLEVYEAPPLPAQGGNVFGEDRATGLLVNKLPDFVAYGAPTSLTPLLIPLFQTSVSLGPAPIPPADNEWTKEA